MTELLKVALAALCILLLSIGACSCASEPVSEIVPVNLDKLELSDREAFLSAGREWTKATGSLAVVEALPARVTVQYGTPDNVLGYYDDPKIWIAAGLGPELARRVLIHELGHMWGLDHNQGSVMQPQMSDNTARCIDAETLAYMCTNRPCARFVVTCPTSSP